MKNALRACLLGAITAMAGTAAQASPVTFAFSGTMENPLDGATTAIGGTIPFSGTFFYELNQPALITTQGSTSAGPYAEYEEQGNPGVVTPGTYFGMTLNVGNQTFNTTNNTLGDLLSIDYNSKSSDFIMTFSLINKYTGADVGMDVRLTNDQRQVFSSVAPPPSLNLADFDHAVVAMEIGSIEYVGIITALQPVEVPEPSSLLVFAAAGAGLAFRFARARKPACPGR